MRSQSGEVDVFERSDDFSIPPREGGTKAESHAEREDSAYLNQSISFSALGKRRAPERSGEAQSEA